MTNLKIQKESIIKNNKIVMILVIVTLFVVFLVGALSYYRHEYKLINYKSDYQAVFLNNGQVYFGKIVKENDDTIILKDVYYLKIKQDLQDSENKSDDSNLSLVKLGKEIHGPSNTMYIIRSNVLFTEELKNDSQVVQAINSYKE